LLETSYGNARYNSTHYFDIDAEVILKTIKEDVPFLIKTLSKIYKELE
jgi:uncharacterized protein with HEPN domain